MNPLLTIEADPTTFYALADIAGRGLPPTIESKIQAALAQLESLENAVMEEVRKLGQANHDMQREVDSASRRRTNPFKLEEEMDPWENLKHTASGGSFLTLFYEVIKSQAAMIRASRQVVEGIRPAKIMLFGEPIRNFRNQRDMQSFASQVQMNQTPIARYLEGIFQAENLPKTLTGYGEALWGLFDGYYQRLTHRHTIEGIQIHGDPVVTDVALTIFENVDASGEIEDGKNPNEISAYSYKKALVLARAVKSGVTGVIMGESDALMDHVISSLESLWSLAQGVSEVVAPATAEVRKALGPRAPRKVTTPTVDFDRVRTMIKDLDPQSIIYRDKTGMMSAEERRDLSFRNETLAKIVEFLRANEDGEDMIHYILARKKELRDFYRDENSFYVCRISAGNPFGGEAPGALEVIPGIKPNVNLDEVVGSGFKEIRDFVGQIEEGAKWHDLFLALSPSKRADKANALLVGPQGCLDEETFIRYEVRTKDGRRVNHKGGPIGRLYQRFHGLGQDAEGPAWSKGEVEYYAPSINDEGRVLQNRIVDVIDSGVKPCYEVTLRGGETIVATADHKFFVGDGYLPLAELRVGSYVFAHRNVKFRSAAPGSRANRRTYLFVKHHPIAGTKVVDGKYVYKRLAKARAVVEAHLNKVSLEEYVTKLNQGALEGLTFMARDMHVHHKDEDIRNDSLDNLVVVNGVAHNREHAKESHNNLRYEVVDDEIVSIRDVGERHVYDVKMEAPFHNVVANGIVVHNCGKSEILRAIGSNRNSIGIFAAPSDFLTCWKGEAEKNPKRLFEAAIKLQKESGKQVYILIDEIDTILNDDHARGGFGATNLTTEFQQLMDGIVGYPHIAVWGATNHPERIPMPMIRRFHKVATVGELDQKDRIALLKQFVGFLPLAKDFPEDAWETLGLRLEGAVGDTIRKIADEVWRSKVTSLVEKHPKVATKAAAYLKEGDEPFQIGKFTPAKRTKLHDILAEAISVTAQDLTESVETHLNNVAIQAEIATAKETYERSKKFLAGIKSRAAH